MTEPPRLLHTGRDSDGNGTHELVGIREISVLLGVQKRTVDQWRRRDVLPDPDFVVSGSPVWWVDRIVAWAEQTHRLERSDD